MVIIASIASTAFVIFTAPRSKAAQWKTVLGGHGTALLVGGISTLLTPDTALTSAMLAAAAVVICVVLMHALEFKHAPAAGTALGIATTGFSISLALAVVGSIGLLGLTAYLFKSHLRTVR